MFHDIGSILWSFKVVLFFVIFTSIIIRVDAAANTYSLSTYAGTGTLSYAGDGGPLSSAL